MHVNGRREPRQRLRQEFESLSKTPHGQRYRSRHQDVRPEWVMAVVEAPYVERTETHRTTGEPMYVLIGRVPEWHRWIKVVFYGTSVEMGAFIRPTLTEGKRRY